MSNIANNIPTNLGGGRTMAEEMDLLLGGFQGEAFRCPPTQAISLIMGHGGEGKSTFVRSCKDAFIINCDCSSASTPPKARVWPAIRADGTPVVLGPKSGTDPQMGVPLGHPLNWNDIREKKAILIDIANRNVPNRPKMVVLDTLDTACRLLEPWIVTEYNRTCGVGKEKKDFADIAAFDSYPARDREIESFVYDLRQAGYGVCLIAHLVDKIITLDNTIGKKTEIKDTWAITDTLFGKLHKLAEFVGVVEMENTQTYEEVPRVDGSGKPVLVNGKPVTDKRPVKCRKCYLSFENGAYRGSAKARDEVPLRIELPKQDGWARFEEVYTQCTQPKES